MKTTLHILHLEDSATDAELIKILLEQTEFNCRIDRVQNRTAFRTELERGGYDLILSDFSMPDLNGLEALEMTRSTRPEIPFIFVSGTIIEEVAIEAMNNGATDYILKDRIARLGPAVKRAMAERDKRMELMLAKEAMIQSEFKYRQIFECLCEAAILADAQTSRIVDANHQAEILFDRPREEIVGFSWLTLHPEMTLQDYRDNFVKPAQADGRNTCTAAVSKKDGDRVQVDLSIAPILLYDHNLLLGLYRNDF